MGLGLSGVSLCGLTSERKPRRSMYTRVPLRAPLRVPLRVLTIGFWGLEGLGSICTTIMELGTERPSLLWFGGADSIMVVYMGPLGTVDDRNPALPIRKFPKIRVPHLGVLITSILLFRVLY